MRVLYRIRQFWRALIPGIKAEDISQVRQVLSHELMALFLRMHRSEQMHSVRIYRQLCQQDETNSDMLAAALLHDVGKICFPLRVQDRVMIVLGKAFFPKLCRVWAQSEPRGWRRPFVVAEMHPQWGAELVLDAGASALTATLVRRHQEEIVQADQSEDISLEDQLLFRLQALDNES